VRTPVDIEVYPVELSVKYVHDNLMSECCLRIVEKMSRQAVPRNVMGARPAIIMVFIPPPCSCDLSLMLVSGVTKLPSIKGFEFRTFVIASQHIAASHLFYN